MTKIAARLGLGWRRMFTRRQSERPTRLRRTFRDLRTIWGDPRLVLTPAQRRAIYARSSSWRCIGCGKIHGFDQSVAVVYASPCTCGAFEFESVVTALVVAA